MLIPFLQENNVEIFKFLLFFKDLLLLYFFAKILAFKLVYFLKYLRLKMQLLKKDKMIIVTQELKWLKTKTQLLFII